MIKSMQDDQLIFMISLPRSGSTLLQKILGNHSEIYTRSEPWLMLHPLSALKKGIIQARYNASLAHDGTHDFISNIPVEGETFYYKQLSKCYLSLYEAYLAESNKNRFLDKTPRYYEIFDELQKTFPNAKFIILYRNPLAILASILETWIKADYEKLKDYSCDLIGGIEFLKRDFSSYRNTHTVRYEELLLQPENITMQLFEFLQIPNESNCIEYGNQTLEHWRFGDPSTVYNKKRPDPEHISAWQSQLSIPENRKLLSDYLIILGKSSFERLGYNFSDAQDTITQAEENHIDQAPASLSLSNLLLTDLENANIIRRRNSKLRQEVASLNAELQKAQTLLSSTTELIDQQKIQASQLLSQIVKLENFASEKDSIIQQQEKLINTMHEHIAQRDIQIKARDEQLAQRDEQISSRDNLLAEIESEIQKRDIHIRECEKLIKEKNALNESQKKHHAALLIQLESLREHNSTLNQQLSFSHKTQHELEENLACQANQIVSQAALLSERDSLIDQLKQTLADLIAASEILKTHKTILHPIKKLKSYDNLLQKLNSTRRQLLTHQHSKRAQTITGESK
ncbi:sulfotransferase [Stutzerimonas stutzeri]|uniref:sulfotransferase n=1 Tax=Stutzerimonas stutzeri TaxID=316 RepID=UPI002447C3FB|nr:sulfotransferase [Stutzerimonas stutzeri]MDH1543291.1 sulfotransferase [Stutzerimonas stutzeri]